MSCVQSTVVESAKNILNRHTVQGLTDCLAHAVLRPRRDPAKLSLELRPQLLDRVVVGAVRRQGQGSRPRTLDRLCHVSSEVGFEVVEDHHVPRTEFRDQHLIHIGLERLRVGCLGESQRCRTPSWPRAAITVVEPHKEGTEPSARLPRRAQAWVGVIAVLTPVSSTKTSRFASIRRTFARYLRRLASTSRASRSRHAGSSSSRSGGNGGGCPRGSSGCR